MLMISHATKFPLNLEAYSISKNSTKKNSKKAC